MSRWSVVAVLLLMGPGAAQAAGADAARAALLRADNEWAELAASGKDVERIVAFWTDDAVIYPPGEAPIAGKEAIRAYVGASLKIPGFSIGWKPSEAVVASGGDLGYTTGTNTFIFPDAQGRLTTVHGRYVTVWRKAEDGRWRCVVDFWNEAPRAPAEGLSVKRSVTLEGSPEATWSLIGDYCGIEKWDPGVAKCEIASGTNNRPGAVRLLTLGDGSTMTEELVRHESGLRTYSYRILRSLLPVVAYEATITVLPASRGGSVVEWESTFKAAPGTSDEAARKTIEAIYDDGLASLRAKEAAR